MPQTIEKPLSLPCAQSPVGAFDLSAAVPGPSRFVAISSAVRRLVRQIEMVAPHLELALIEGEPGAGKETLARLLHSRSVFSRSSFNRFDAREWLLSEVDPQLFSGFNYLERIDLLAAPGQALLLRCVKMLRGRASGSFALVASTETSLPRMAGEGRLLPDLAFMFAAIRFAVPPLRQRREDIMPLATHFLKRLSERYGLPPIGLTPGAAARLLQHSWPGNARELSSVLESALVESASGYLRAEDLSIAPSRMPLPRVQSPIVLNLDEVIRDHIRLVLELNHGNKLRSARQLGISRSTLYRLLDGVLNPSS